MLPFDLLCFVAHQDTQVYHTLIFTCKTLLTSLASKQHLTQLPPKEVKKYAFPLSLLQISLPIDTNKLHITSESLLTRVSSAQRDVDTEELVTSEHHFARNDLNKEC